MIQVPEILHKEFQIEWYEFANQYAVEHYKENSVVKNEEFYNFTREIDDLMHKKILNVTKFDITKSLVDSTEFLGELYRNGSITSKQLTEIVDFGRRLQYPYVQKVIEFYNLTPSHFNATRDIFCVVFDCPTTTTVTGMVTTTPTSSSTASTTTTSITTTTTTISTTTETFPITRNDPLAAPILVPTTSLVIMSINFIMNCLLHL